jgi:fucose permease
VRATRQRRSIPVVDPNGPGRWSWGGPDCSAWTHGWLGQLVARLHGPMDGPRSAPTNRGTIGRSFDVLSLLSFVVLGIPDGMLGTAWPSMRQAFHAPIGDLGLILLVTSAGSAAVTAVVGPLLRRIGIPTLLAMAGTCAALGASGFALAPGLWLVLSVAVLLGVAAGMMDAGLNTAIALSGRRRLLNLLHGAYGIGTAIGPLVVTAAILSGSWRIAYVTLVVIGVALAAAWLLHRRHDRLGQDPQEAVSPSESDQSHRSDGWSRRRSNWVVSIGMAVFFVYTGLEVAAGQWEASFCRGHLGLSAVATGIATFGFWATLTAVRFALALVPRPVSPSSVIWWGCVLSGLGAGAIWWEPDTAVAVAGFVLLGGALAGVFPALITLTPARIGPRRAQHVIAWQVGAAAVGGSGLSALLGLLINSTSLAILGPSLTVLAVLLVGGNLTLARIAPVATRVGRK